MSCCACPNTSSVLVPNTTVPQAWLDMLPDHDKGSTVGVALGLAAFVMLMLIVVLLSLRWCAKTKSKGAGLAVLNTLAEMRSMSGEMFDCADRDGPQTVCGVQCGGALGEA